MSVFVTHEHHGGKNYAIFADAAASHPACIMSSIEKNADSLVKGMIFFDQKGGGRGGGNRSWSKLLPPVSLWSACYFLFFLVSFAKDFF